LELLGSRKSSRRTTLYQRCRKLLSSDSRSFWDSHPDDIERGIGSAGKFERYFEIFRTRVLPWVHSRERVDRLLAGGPQNARQAFYRQEWDTWRWRFLFKLFFSRFVMGRLGRDPAFFRYVQGSVAERILSRTEYALTELDPAANPYLQWVLTGTHTTALPFALRLENFDPIRRYLERLEWTRCSLEDLLRTHTDLKVDRWNLSDIFEYMSPENHGRLLETLSNRSKPGARLAYWNMLAPRRRPDSLAGRLRSLDVLANDLFSRDNAWFYCAFVVEEVIA
jgi:S-adenosylmethionine-diacylglycerol 3-amino-3-carboxypropyl transferase